MYKKFLDDLTEYISFRKRNRLPSQSYEESLYAVRDSWIKDQKYKALILFILENWNEGNCEEFSRPLSQHLIDSKQLQLFKLLWKGIIANRLKRLWKDYEHMKRISPGYSLKNVLDINLEGFNQFSSSEPMDRRIAWRRLYVIDGISEFIRGLEKLEDNNEINRQNNLSLKVSSLEKPEPRPSNDKRKIDEFLFWKLIEENRAKSTDKIQFIENLKLSLEGFYPDELRNFDKLLRIKVGELNTWEIWALAYIVRRGCGHDEFDYFKAWVISKGQNSFLTVKNMNEDKLAALFDEDPQLEEFYYMAEEVYEDKTHSNMNRFEIKPTILKGKKWSEQEIKERFSALWKLFNHD